MNLPWWDFAKEHNYELQYYSADRTFATYVKGLPDGSCIFLSCSTINENTLEREFGLIQCKIGPFSLPNQGFDHFEKQLSRLMLPEE